MKAIALIVTLGNRPEMLAETAAAWAGVADTEVRVIAGFGPMGVGINRAYEDVADDEVAVSVCDDCVPQFTSMDGALDLYERRQQPSPRLLRRDGTPWAPYDGDPDGARANWTRFPMASGRLFREIGPMLPTTNYIDFDYSSRLTLAGWGITLCHAFSFLHLDGPHTWQNPELDAHEAEVYAAAQAATDAAARARGE